MSSDLERPRKTDLAGQLIVVHVDFQRVDHRAGKPHDFDVLELQINVNRLAGILTLINFQRR